VCRDFLVGFAIIWIKRTIILQHTPLDSQAVVTAYMDAIGDWGLRIEAHEVQIEDTLPLLALRYYDDPLKWEVITHFNGMQAGDTIHDGDVLLIPEPNLRPIVIPPPQNPIGVVTQWEKMLEDNLDHPKPR
jgi:hypothetical protein